MDCCNYEYRAGGYAAPPWEGYAPYAPLPYAPYAPYYAPHAHAHDPYARYYRYDYPAHHAHHTDHVLPMDYGAYASKEARVRRALARRDVRLPAQHLPLPPTPPLECGMNSRGSSYCEPQMWSHYQMGVMGGGGWSGSCASGAWTPRGACARDHARYSSDCRPMKGAQQHLQNPMCGPDGRSTPYPVYEESHYSGQSGAKHSPSAPPRAGVPPGDPARARDRFTAEPRRSPPQEVRPPVVPLPAFQQAFGSTEIGKFAEAFSRAEVALEDGDNFSYEAFPEWEPPEPPEPPEPQWSQQPAAREIKCEDNF